VSLQNLCFSAKGSSLCNLCVLRVSVVVGFAAINQRDTEDTEVAQRNQFRN